MTETTLSNLGLCATLSGKVDIHVEYSSGTVGMGIGDEKVFFDFDDIDAIQSVLTQLQVEVKNRVGHTTQNSTPSENMLNELDDDFGDCERDPDPVFDEVSPL